MHTQLNVKTVLFQIIQLSISTLFSSIWPIDRVRSDATTLGQSGPGSDGNEGVFRFPKNSSITGTSPSDCLVSYQDIYWGGGILPLCRDAVGVFYSPSWLGKPSTDNAWIHFPNPTNDWFGILQSQPTRTEEYTRCISAVRPSRRVLWIWH